MGNVSCFQHFNIAITAIENVLANILKRFHPVNLIVFLKNNIYH